MVISLDKFEKPGVIEDGVGMLKILKLVLYYELGKEDLLEYCLQNTQRYLFRHQKEFTLLKVIHGYISKSVKTNSQYEKGKLYRELEREINRTIQKNPDSHIYLLVNFQLWVRNKTLQFPFKEEESAKLHLKH